MSLGLEKCGQMIVKRGKVVKINGLKLLADHIADIQTSYKYLGTHGNHDEEVRKTATANTQVQQRYKIDPEAQWEEQDSCQSPDNLPV